MIVTESFIIAMVFQSVMLISFIVAIVCISKQPKVNKIVLVLWINGMVFVCFGFVLIYILTDPAK